MTSIIRGSRLRRFAIGAFLISSVGSSLNAATGDWPQWRGPHRDDISAETGLLKDWPDSGPALVWEIKGLGSGYSSISIEDGKIFTMGDEGGTTSVIAMTLEGKKLWSTPVGPTANVGYPGPRCTPTVDKDLVFSISSGGDLLGMNTVDGKVVWRTHLSNDLGGRMMSGWGYAESPTVDGDKLLCTPGGKEGTVAALDKKTGKVLWRSKNLTDAASYASLVPADIGGIHQDVVLTDSSVAGIGGDGTVLWRVPRHGETAVIPTPVVKDNLVFVTSGYGVGANCFKVEGSGTNFKAEQIYAVKHMAVHHGGVVDVGDYLYGANDAVLMCLAIKDGKVAWTNRSVGKGAIAYADGRLYLRSESSGNIALVEATPDGYKEHGILKQPDRSKENAWSHPVIAGGKLYLRDQDVLLCYDIKAK